MKVTFFTLLSSLVLFACEPTLKPTDVALLNGYWEIKRVEFKDQKAKEYKINETFDYYKMNGLSGVRSKVMPQLDGTFLANGDTQNVLVTIQGQEAFMNNSTNFIKWREEIVKLTSGELVLRSADQRTYYYEKTKPINLIPDGQKTSK